MDGHSQSRQWLWASTQWHVGKQAVQEERLAVQYRKKAGSTAVQYRKKGLQRKACGKSLAAASTTPLSFTCCITCCTTQFVGAGIMLVQYHASVPPPSPVSLMPVNIPSPHLSAHHLPYPPLIHLPPSLTPPAGTSASPTTPVRPSRRSISRALSDSS